MGASGCLVDPDQPLAQHCRCLLEALQGQPLCFDPSGLSAAVASR